MDNTKLKVAIVSFPWRSHAPYKFLSDMLKILEPISDKIILIDGNTERINITSKKVSIVDIGIRMHYLKDIRPTIYSAIIWIAKCISTNIRTSLELIRLRKDIDIVMFYMAYPHYLLPLITSKILRKKTVDIITRSRSNSLFHKIISLQDPILFGLLDGISPESHMLINELHLDKYKNKLLPEGARFIDTSNYIIKMRLKERKNVVGYVGRITKEKGIINIIDAIPILSKKRDDIEFLICGHGDLLNWIKERSEKIEKDCKVKITITGFIKEEEIVDNLNRFKLFVLPTSHAEGLPTTILEAMACGTPVLTTPVGAVLDIIRDGENGFILEDNSSECIADNIIRILEHPNLDKIVDNASKTIKSTYGYENAVERYKKILNRSV